MKLVRFCIAFMIIAFFGWLLAVSLYANGIIK